MPFQSTFVHVQFTTVSTAVQRLVRTAMLTTVICYQQIHHPNIIVIITINQCYHHYIRLLQQRPLTLSHYYSNTVSNGLMPCTHQSLDRF